jgi:hypothetical protein
MRKGEQMNIIFETEVTPEIAEKYTLLELDTFRRTSDGKVQKSFCVLTNEDITLQEIALIERQKELHANLIKNYKKQDWNYCQEALSNLYGKWKGEVDTFYTVLSKRITEFREKHPEDQKDWDHIITIPQ